MHAGAPALPWRVYLCADRAAPPAAWLLAGGQSSSVWAKRPCPDQDVDSMHALCRVTVVLGATFLVSRLVDAGPQHPTCVATERSQKEKMWSVERCPSMANNLTKCVSVEEWPHGSGAHCRCNGSLLDCGWRQGGESGGTATTNNRTAAPQHPTCVATERSQKERLWSVERCPSMANNLTKCVSVEEWPNGSGAHCRWAPNGSLLNSGWRQGGEERDDDVGATVQYINLSDEDRGRSTVDPLLGSLLLISVAVGSACHTFIRRKPQKPGWLWLPSGCSHATGPEATYPGRLIAGIYWVGFVCS